MELAAVQKESAPNPNTPVYDDEHQMTYLREPSYQAAIDSTSSVQTKKADREKHEDQKGF